MNASAIANVITMQCYRCYPNIPLDTFIFIYVATMQRRKRYTCISMNTSPIVNVITMQLGTSCSFDSPGLARNEPTPGEHPQGDSTPSVLSFFCEGTLTMKPLVTDYSKKAQHLWRCSPHNIR
ncbi:tetrahydrofolate synthase [Segatella salivae]|uniref:tetrahydrofolate synthase n=1 Tax=Segatella salivae TaxID=228604 RepID=UPI0028E6FF4D|nr:tetrahydrofolate synthase [Segatella salivae]